MNESLQSQRVFIAFCVILIVIALAVVWILFGVLSFFSALAGSLVGFINVLIAFWFNQRALKRSSNDLLKPLLTGIFVRLLVICIATLVVIKFSPLKAMEYIVAFLVCYFIFQFVEIKYLQKRMLVNGKRK